MTQKATIIQTPTAPKAAGDTGVQEEVRDINSKQDGRDAPAEPAKPEDADTRTSVASQAFGISERTVIVIAAAGAMAELMLRMWQKTAVPADIRIVPVLSLAETMANIIADDLIPDEFIFVPHGCFPTARMTLADLSLYRRRVLPKGKTAEHTGLPMLLTKEHLVDTLKEFTDPVPPADEDFIGRYNEIAHAGEIPNQVAFSFGNAVGYVTRPDFCPAVLIDFLRLRKFVCVTPEAFPTAQPYLEEYAKR